MSRKNTPAALIVIAIACIVIAVTFSVILYKNVSRPQSDPAPIIGITGAVSGEEETGSAGINGKGNSGPTVEEYYNNSLWEEVH